MGPIDGEEAFLSRWSRRKEAVRAGEELEELAEPGAENLPVETPDAPEEDEHEEIDLDALPDIETMDKESDFAQFMQKGIPDALRNKALRKLWLSDPVLANVDGLVDYGEDFTGDGLAGKAFKTAWKIGQGFLTDDELAELRETVDGPAEPDDASEEENDLAGDQPETEVAEDLPASDDPPGEAVSLEDDAELTEKS